MSGLRSKRNTFLPSHPFVVCLRRRGEKKKKKRGGKSAQLSPKPRRAPVGAERAACSTAASRSRRRRCSRRRRAGNFMRSLSPPPAPPSPPPAPLAARHTRSGSRYWAFYWRLSCSACSLFSPPWRPGMWGLGGKFRGDRAGGGRASRAGRGRERGRTRAAHGPMAAFRSRRPGTGERRSGEGEGGEHGSAGTEAVGPWEASAVLVPRSSGPARRTQRGWRARATGGLGVPWGARSEGALWRTPPRSPALGPPRPHPTPTAPSAAVPTPISATPTLPLGYSPPLSLCLARSGGDFPAQRRS